jgi:hypothetical protein
MKKLVRAAVAAAVLSVGAASPAFADLVLPSTGASGAALTLFDSQGQRSLIVSLNVGYNDLLPSIMNQETGYSIANAVSASDQGELAAFIGGGGNLTWWVTAADSAGGAFSGKNVMTTGVGGLSVAATNSGISQAAGVVENFFGRVNSVCGTDDTCFADFEAETAPDPDDFAAYAGNAWGPRLNNNLSAALGNGTAIGVAQGFYLYSTSSNTGAQPATRTAYANALGFGTWNLNSAGVLSYTLNGASAAVPLPAAVWLLGSGLLGMAAVRRRRQAGEVVAA